MAPERPPIELGFAEFVSQLVAETHQAVNAAQAEQARRHDDLVKAARLPLEEFARRFVPEATVERELRCLFPPRRPGRPHGLVPGVRVVLRRGDRADLVAGALGLPVEGTPERKRAATRGVRLTRRDVAKIRTAVRERLAGAQLAALKESVARGMPRVLVDSGRITAKLTFRLQDVSRSGGDTRRRLTIPLTPLPGAARALRLVVRQVDPAQVVGSEAAAVGEVEITFKTAD